MGNAHSYGAFRNSFSLLSEKTELSILKTKLQEKNSEGVRQNTLPLFNAYSNKKYLPLETSQFDGVGGITHFGPSVFQLMFGLLHFCTMPFTFYYSFRKVRMA